MGISIWGIIAGLILKILTRASMIAPRPGARNTICGAEEVSWLWS
jgi:hypothetical protein